MATRRQRTLIGQEEPVRGLPHLAPSLKHDGDTSGEGALYFMSIGSISAGKVTTNNYRPDIDGLRAVAVLLVVFFHAGFSATSGGFVGVDIFFVISGYLITGIIARELDEDRFSFCQFYARRIKRICPALFVVLSLSSLAAFFLLIPRDLRDFGRSITSAVLFYSNWDFYRQVGYFDGPAIEKPLLHTWSLAIEEQFYLIWPAAFYALYRAAGRKWMPRIILALLCVSLAGSELILQFDQAQAFYLLPFRAWELLLGAYLAIAPNAAISGRAANSLGVFAIVAIAASAFAYNAKTQFPGFHALLPCLGAAALIFTGLRNGILANGILGVAPVRFAGKISYSLYLFHWPLFSFAHLFLDRPLLLEERLFIVAASIAMAALSYWYIETPARRSGLPFSILLRAAMPAAAILVVCGIVYHSSGGLPGRMPATILALFTDKDRLAEPSCRDDAVPAFGTRPCAVGAFAPGMQYDFAVWGDSHSSHLSGAFAEQAAKLGLAGLVISRSACPPFVNGTNQTRACQKHNKMVQQWLTTQRKLRVVFLAGYWKWYLPELTATVNEGAAVAKAGEPGAGGGLRETVNLLRSIGVSFAFIEDVPSFPMNISDCVARARMFGRPEKRCLEFKRDDIERASEQASSLIRDISRNCGAPLIETVAAFCERDICHTERGGVILYRDSNHLNTAGSHYLGTRLKIPWPASQTAQGDTAALNAAAGER